MNITNLFEENNTENAVQSTAIYPRGAGIEYKLNIIAIMS